MNKLVLIIAFITSISFHVMSQVSITESGGWFETAFAKWKPFQGASSYNVYYSGMGFTDKKIDTQLIRSYGTYMRVDALGLAAGTYTLKVVPVVSGVENLSAVSVTPTLTVIPYVREGFAFADGLAIGGYNADGTVKSNAKIFYLSASTVNTITCAVKDSKGVAIQVTGLISILTAYRAGYERTPLIFRMIGLIKTSQINGLSGNDFIAIEGTNGTTRKVENITFEGVGIDATAYGYGFEVKRSKSVEIRNIGIMMFTNDGVSIDTDNAYTWIHNIDFFYGTPGSDADQVKGDGSIDIKYKSTYITLSNNHFWDSGKVLGCGGATGEDKNLFISYHHNWFDHADSRCPRLTNTTAHMYNNYFDGVSKYSVGASYNTSAFVEANYFRHSDRPMTISMQGTDRYNSVTGLYDLKGTFSNQDGGMIKAFNNKLDNCDKYVPQTINAIQFDAYEVTNKNDSIPSTVKSVQGSYIHNNFDTKSTMYTYKADTPDDAKVNVLNYAGRMNGGDFKWTFDNAVDDDSYIVNLALKVAIVGYQTKLVGVQSENGTINGLETPLSDRICIYPNPVISIMIVTSDVYVLGIEIYSISGNLIQTFKSNGNNNEVDVSNLNSGLYLAIFKTENGKIQKLFIKQ